jgi:hypothetical protein
VTLSASGGTLPGDAVGTYSLVPGNATGGTFNPANYAIQYVNGSLRVDLAPTTISVNGPSQFTGDGTPQGPTNVVVIGSTGTIQLTYSGETGSSFSPGPIMPIEPGNYSVVASVTTDGQYEAAVSAPFNFTILPPDTATSDVPLLPPWGIMVLAAIFGLTGAKQWKRCNRDQSG